jgi:hypothetical protein
MFIYSYCYVCSVVCILFSSCQLAFFSYPGKCQGIFRKDGARSALFLISELCCSVYFLSIVLFYVLFLSIVLFYVFFVCKCVPYYCHWVSTQLQLNISYPILSYHIIYHIIYHTISSRVWLHNNKILEGLEISSEAQGFLSSTYSRKFEATRIGLMHNLIYTPTTDKYILFLQVVERAVLFS